MWGRKLEESGSPSLLRYYMRGSELGTVFGVEGKVAEINERVRRRN
jgi:hypothetical protein